MSENTLFHIPLFFYILVLALLLPRIPFAGKFFRIISTALHEFGHAAIALITQGKVNRIELFRNSEGSTYTQSKSQWSNFLIAMAGYPFVSSVAYGCFYLLSAGYEKHLIAGLTLLFFLMLIFWIRNRFGIVWVIFFAILNTAILYVDKEPYIHLAALFYSTIILTESVISTLVLVYLSFRSPKESGDAANLKRITRIPAWVWALLFAGYALWIAYKVVENFIL